MHVIKYALTRPNISGRQHAEIFSEHDHSGAGNAYPSGTPAFTAEFLMGFVLPDL
jgi:hypothetical protein